MSFNFRKAVSSDAVGRPGASATQFVLKYWVYVPIQALHPNLQATRLAAREAIALSRNLRHVAILRRALWARDIATKPRE